MTLFYSLIFGAGVAGFAYSRMERRIGYGNTQNVAVLVAIVFIVATAFFFTVLSTFVHLK